MKQKFQKSLKLTSLILCIMHSSEAGQEIRDLFQRRNLNIKRGVRALNSETFRSDRASQKGDWGVVASIFEEGVMLNLETQS